MGYQVITVTLNPALDVTLWADRIDFAEPVKATAEKVYAGGKSLNISRVLTGFGIANKAVGIAGKNNLPSMQQLLEQDQVKHEFVTTPGSIRENVTLCLADGKVLKINRSGPEVAPALLDEVASLISRNLSEDTIIVFSGGMPPNLSKEDYSGLIGHFTQRNHCVAVDNDVFDLATLERLHPFIIKPNEVEFEKLTGRQGLTPPERLKEIERVVQLTDHLLLSLGADGAIYANRREAYHIHAPKVTVNSTVGAGDTTLACFLTAWMEGSSFPDCARYAVAGGTASVQLDGTASITRADWQNVIDGTTIEQIL